MKRPPILTLLAIFILSISSFGQVLTDTQVIFSINGSAGKHRQIGLTLNDVQTNLLSGLACRTCKTTGYTIYVYTPESWIELKAVQARREMLPFSLENVTPEMRLPYIHVLATPSRPEYLNASGMGMASSVHRVVLSSTDKSDVIQPLSESKAEVDSNSALRSFTQSSAGAVFSVEDVERLRSEDPRREFFIVVVGDNQNKYFKVKARFFNQLFGRNSDNAYAGMQSYTPEPKATRKPAPDSGSVTVSKIPSTAKAATSVARTNSNPDIPSITPTTPTTTPDAFAGTVKSNPPQNRATEKVAGEQSDAYRHDSALIAKWWGLREPDARDSETENSKSSADSLGTAETALLGVRCNEKPRIRHDGVRVDRIAPDGPADQSGLRVGDDILALDGVFLFTVEELMNQMHHYKPGAKVSVRYRRRATIYDTFVIMGSEETHKAAN